jgi:hypothetical protein
MGAEGDNPEEDGKKEVFRLTNLLETQKKHHALSLLEEGNFIDGELVRVTQYRANADAVVGKLTIARGNGKRIVGVSVTDSHNRTVPFTLKTVKNIERIKTEEESA